MCKKKKQQYLLFLTWTIIILDIIVILRDLKMQSLIGAFELKDS